MRHVKTPATVVAGIAVAAALALAPPPAANASAKLVADPPVRIKDLDPGTGGSFPGLFTKVGNTIFFYAYDTARGAELWRTAGTAASTTRVADIKPGSGSSFPASFTKMGGKLYFVADDGASGQELWRSDGTNEGTSRVANINPGASSGLEFSELINVDGTLFFRANDGVSGDELWRSDGTAAGTKRVADISPGASGSYPDHFTQAGGILYFTANDSTHGTELWRTDGSAAGTRQVADLSPGAEDSHPGALTSYRGALYFAATNEEDRYLWVTDGTASGTTLVSTIDPPLDAEVVSAINPTDLTVAGDSLYFVAEGDDGELGYGREVWASDGTATGTAPVADINPGLLSSIPLALTEVGDELYFRAITVDSGFEVWHSDGTTDGTQQVRDINPGPDGSTLNGDFTNVGITDVGGVAYFRATDGVHGEELWRSDGTEAGTQLVADLNPGAPSSAPLHLAAVDDTLYLSLDDGVTGWELWRLGPELGTSDLTPPQTTINSGPANGSTTNNATPVFGFSSDESGSTFECKVDSGPFTTCTSPFTLPELTDGPHTFHVRATDASGNTDATPATRSFTVATGAGPSPDTTVEGVQVAGPKTQQVKGKKLTVRTSLTASVESVSARLQGSVLVTTGAGRQARSAAGTTRLPLTTRASRLSTGDRLDVTQQFSGGAKKVRRATRVVKAALKDGRSVVAVITVQLRDDAGNRKRVTRKVKLL